MPYAVTACVRATRNECRHTTSPVKKHVCAWPHVTAIAGADVGSTTRRGCQIRQTMTRIVDTATPGGTTTVTVGRGQVPTKQPRHSQVTHKTHRETHTHTVWCNRSVFCVANNNGSVTGAQCTMHRRACIASAMTRPSLLDTACILPQAHAPPSAVRKPRAIPDHTQLAAAAAAAAGCPENREPRGTILEPQGAPVIQALCEKPHATATTCWSFISMSRPTICTALAASSVLKQPSWPRSPLSVRGPRQRSDTRRMHHSSLIQSFLSRLSSSSLYLFFLVAVANTLPYHTTPTVVRLDHHNTMSLTGRHDAVCKTSRD